MYRITFFIIINFIICFTSSTQKTFAFQKSSFDYYVDQPPSAGSFTKHHLPQTKLASSPLTENQVMDSVLSYLSLNPHLIGNLSVDNLKIKYTSSIPADLYRPGMVYIHWVQQKNNSEIEGTYVNVSVSVSATKTVLLSLSGRVYPSLSSPTYSFLSSTTLIDPKEKAEQALKLSSGTCVVEESQETIRYLGGEWLEVSKIKCAQSHLKAIVDKNSGLTWLVDTRVWGDHAILGTVQGRGVIFDPVVTGENLDILPLRHLELRLINADPVLSGPNGEFAISSQNLPNEIQATLTGRYAAVHDYLGQDLAITQNIDASSSPSLLFNPMGAEENSTAQVNGYYHTTFIHDWVRERLPSPQNELIDLQLPVNVNITEEQGPNGERLPVECNAFFSPFLGSINFYHSGPSCPNMAFDTIVSHEYGHFVDNIYGFLRLEDLANSGLSEGWGDVFAAFASNQPVLGETSWIIFRTTDNQYQYPPSGLEEDPHVLGQAWAGFAWDLRDNLILKYGGDPEDPGNLSNLPGIQKAESLVIPTIVADPPNIPEAVLEVILLDDNMNGDADLTNGTPHLSEIIAAASAHSIPMPYFALITAPQNGDSFIAREEVPISATVLEIALQIFTGSYQLFYQKIPKDMGEVTLPVAIGQPLNEPGENREVAVWNTTGLEPGGYWIILELTNNQGQKLQSRVEIVLLENIPGRITGTNNIDEKAPDIDGDWIVWTEAVDNNVEVVVYNILTGEKEIIPNDSGSSISSNTPRIFFPWVIWTTGGSGRNTWQLYAYNLESNSYFPLEQAQRIQLYPEIYANKVIWIERTRNVDKVWIYDLLSNNSQELPNQSNNAKGYLAIFGNNIVGVENNEIYLYDLSQENPQPRQITNDGAWKGRPGIYGEKIVWIAGITLYLYDIARGTLETLYNLPNDFANQDHHVDFNGHLIVFDSKRPGVHNRDIFAYDIDTRTIHLLSEHPTEQLRPRISGNRIVYEDYRDGDFLNNADIFIYEFPSLLFIRGDANEDNQVDISDALRILSILFQGETRLPSCLEALDANNDDSVDISDAVYILLYLFRGTNPPPPPYPEPGICPMEAEGGGAGGEVIDPEVTLEDCLQAQELGIVDQISACQPPTTPVVMDGGAYANRRDQLYASWTATDTGSGLTEYQYRITDNSGGEIRGWTSTGLGSSVTASGLNLTEGRTYSFGVKAKNTIGVWSEEGRSDGIIVDGTAPTGTVSINKGAVYASKTSVTLNLTASDALSGMGTGAQMQFSNDGITYSIPQAFASLKTWTLTTGSGTKKVYVKFKDVAGNWSNAFTDTIILDTTRPTTPVLTDEGAVSPSKTALRASWTSSDAQSGIVDNQYMIKDNLGNVVKNWTSTGTTQTVYATSLPLVEGRTYYFHVKTKNGAGLWSFIGVSDGILVEDK